MNFVNMLNNNEDSEEDSDVEGHRLSAGGKADIRHSSGSQVCLFVFTTRVFY